MSNLTQGTVYAPTMFLNCATVTGITGQTAKTFSATAQGTGAKLEWCIKGKSFTKSSISGGAVPTTDINTGAAFTALTANKGCVFVMALNAGGDVCVAQGPVVGLNGANFADAPEFPFLSDLYAPFCYVVVKADSTASSWLFGTGNWDATGITATPVNVVALCDRPQVS